MADKERLLYDEGYDDGRGFAKAECQARIEALIEEIKSNLPKDSWGKVFENIIDEVLAKYYKSGTMPEKEKGK